MTTIVDEYVLPESRVRPAGWRFSAVTLLTLIVVLSLGVLEVKAPLPLMMIIGFLLAMGFACLRGVPFEEVQGSAFAMMRRGFPPLMIFVAVGALIAAWAFSGTVPVMVYYGSQLVEPRFFLPAALIACALTSLVNGSSFGTIGTIGVALMGIAAVIGVPVGWAAGAVICGALLGDKMSPLSETTVMAPGLAGANLFSHIRHMMWTTLPAAAIALVIFTVMSLTHDVDGDADAKAELGRALGQVYELGWPTLIPPVVVIVLLVLRWDAFPTLMVGALAGAAVAVTYQGAAIGDVATAMWRGYQVPTEPDLTAVLAPGDTGALAMLGLGAIILFALGIAGCLASCGILQSLMEAAQARLTTTRRLVPATLGLTLFISLFSGVINFAVAMSATLLRPVYERMGVANVNLSRAVEDAGTMFAPLIPWGVNAIFITATLNVSVSEYAPYAFLCFLSPAISLLLGLTGWTITRSEPTAEVTAPSTETAS